MLTVRSRLAALSAWERRHDGAFLRRPDDPLADDPLADDPLADDPLCGPAGAAADRALAWSRACDREARGLVATLAAARRCGRPPPPEVAAALARLRRAGLAWRAAAAPPASR